LLIPGILCNTEPKPLNYKILGKIKMSQVSICEHLHDKGTRCGSPAVRGLALCYFHSRMTQRPTEKNGKLRYPVPALESAESIQLAATHIAQALADDLIDSRKANSLLRALSIAMSSIKLCSKSSNADSATLRIPTFKNWNLLENVGTSIPACAVSAESVDTTIPACAESAGSVGTNIPARAESAESVGTSIPACADFSNELRAKDPITAHTTQNAPGNSLSAAELARLRRTVRHGPKHPLFAAAARRLDAHVSASKHAS
jgi:hypothetical protein